MYTGSSIVDYLAQVGQKSDFASRATLAASKGITGYTGTAQQNTQLLNMLRGGATAPVAAPSTSTPAPAQQTAQPVASPTSVPSAGGGFDSGALIQALISKGYNPVDAQSAATGPRAAELAKEYLGTGGSLGVSGSGSSFLNAPTINLPEIYKGLYDKSGVSLIEQDLSNKSKAYTEAVAKIKDNPYLPEATMTGRLRKLEDKFNADTTNIRSDIATKKADIETQLNIQLKQFDINSDQAKAALSQFNSLLSSGALNSASGEDIAAITRATGLSSSMIKSAIDASKAKDVQTSTIQFDDGTNQGFAIINSRTGEIISKQNVSTSKPKAGSVTDQKNADLQATQKNAIADIKSGSTLRDIINHYVIAGGLTAEEIYRLYNSNSPYGEAGESLDEIKEGKFKA